MQRPLCLLLLPCVFSPGHLYSSLWVSSGVSICSLRLEKGVMILPGDLE